MKTKTAVILCGGLGRRLGSLGKKIPKTLVKIQGKPIIWYIVKFLQLHSFNHFILPLGHKSEKIKEYFKNNKEFKNNKIYINLIDTGKNSSIAQRIFMIKKYIKSKNFALLNGDAIFNFNIRNCFSVHENKKNFITFLGCAAKLNYGIINVFKGKVNSFERDAIFDQISYSKKKNYIGQVYSGISIINRDLLRLKFQNYKNFEKEFYPRVIKKFKTNFNQIQGFWHSIDIPRDVEELYKANNKKKYYEVVKLKKQLIKKNN